MAADYKALGNLPATHWIHKALAKTKGKKLQTGSGMKPGAQPSAGTPVGQAQPMAGLDNAKC